MHFVLRLRIHKLVAVDMQKLTFYTQLSCYKIKDFFKHKIEKNFTKMSDTRRNRYFHLCDMKNEKPLK